MLWRSERTTLYMKRISEKVNTQQIILSCSYSTLVYYIIEEEKNFNYDCVDIYLYF